MFLAGVFVGQHDPLMNDFFEPVVSEFNSLSEAGIPWIQEDGNQVQCRFFPHFLITDAMARCECLSMKSPAAYYGCTLCLHPGVFADGAVRFPIWPPVPNPELRTDQGIKNDMVEATEEGREIRGVKGASCFMNLNYFDLAKDVPIDDLHPLFLGVTESHIGELILRNIITPQKLKTISRRIRCLRTPTFISRKPRGLNKRRNYNGTEWRNLLLYYIIPCSQGLQIPDRYLNHLQLLAKGVFLCSKEGVTNEELDVAENCLREYVQQYELFFGRGAMKFNIHVLLHAVACVRRFGPFYCQSTMHFESWNHRMTKTVKAGKGACDQIVTRFLMRKFVETIESHPDIREAVKREVELILNNRRVRFVLVDNILLLGKSRRRAPSAAERRQLDREGLQCQRVVAFQRAIFETKEYRCSSYTYDGERGLSDNSNILTWDDEFCSIQSILLIQVEGQQVVRLLLKVFNTPNTMEIANYICSIQPGEDIFSLIPFPRVKSHAIKVDIPGRSYIMPISNPYELD